MRVLLVCPGRGSYGRAQLGSLDPARPALGPIEAVRATSGRPALLALDRAASFSPSLHLAGEHASLLTFAATTQDLEAIDPGKVRVVAVAGNSLGFYTALYAAGALSLADAARLVETMGGYQEENVVGGQALYPVCGDDWRPDPTLEAAVEGALAAVEGLWLSIRLGGTVVLGGTDGALARIREALPPVRRGGRDYPLRLPLHSAFHTPLLAPTAERAARDITVPFAAPALPLVGGDAHVWRRHADPAALRAYTLGAQVTTPFDLTAAIRAALGDYGPDAVVLPGPGETLGAPVAQILVACGWRGLRDRRDFDEAQATAPVVLSMARPAQRALVAR